VALIRYKQNLKKVVARIIYQEQVCKKDLQFGDLVIMPPRCFMWVD